MKIIFMGTPDFAVGTLEAIIKAGHEVALVVTQPDKPKGRSGALAPTPVKECALAHNIPVFQPKKIREAENVAYLAEFNADIMVVAAFGQILPKAILDMPKYGCINVHASILPKYRGAAPIQWSIINGDPVTGVTIQKMDVGVDTGDIISIRELAIDPEETGGGLFDKLAVISVKGRNISGAGESESVYEAYMRACKKEFNSPEGCVVITNAEIDRRTALEIIKYPLNAVVAPSYSEDSLEVLESKEGLKVFELPQISDRHIPVTDEFQSISGGVLVQSVNNKLFEENDLLCLTDNQPTEEQQK
ncbi:MAG: methionyl-tRNA formyltransferase, partial [Agathobacter sp.]|nr:methionyl-tRNA formyltransferase [Agathobacter sp.]